MFSFRNFMALLLFLSFSSGVLGEEDAPQSLPNIEIRSVYADGREIISTYKDRLLEYRIVSGRMKGAYAEGLEFDSRKIGDQIYLVSWHDKSNAFYISLIIDLKNNMEYHTSIMGYGDESPRTNFLAAEITGTEILE
jgi:hypothetical protein